MASVLEVAEGLQTQSTGESIVWAINTANRGTPTSPSVATVKNSAGTDVKSTVMPTGSASVATTIISLPSLTALTAGERYEIRVLFTVSGNIQEVIINVDCPL